MWGLYASLGHTYYLIEYLCFFWSWSNKTGHFKTVNLLIEKIIVKCNSKTYVFEFSVKGFIEQSRKESLLCINIIVCIIVCALMC